MKLLTIAVLGLAVAAGCVQSAEDPAAETDPAPVDMAELSQASVLALDPADPHEDVCGLLPCGGPCSMACDYQGLLEQYVPEGTCATFFCELTDGRSVVLDACHAPAPH